MVFFVAGTAFADPPPGYYDSVDATDATTLQATLYNVIDDHQNSPFRRGSFDCLVVGIAAC